MHAPFYPSAKALRTQSGLVRLWLVLKSFVEPVAPAEPGCSARYTTLRRQELWATRLFWLGSAVVALVAVAGATADLLG